MCGITVFLTLGQLPTRKRGECEDEIDRSLLIVKHRGPDASGKWINNDNRVGPGHVRLSIVDLSPEGNQPFCGTENEVYAVVNGEIYDYERYREELAAEYNFQGHSDCEIVLALYKHYGLGFLQHLRGEFALMLWDARRELFIATRNRYGIKSFYYTIVGSRLLVATELKQFLAYGWEPEWDVRAIVESATVFDTRTLFKGVKKHAEEARTEQDMIEGVRQHLLGAVRVRLRADVPVGIYLSGDIDSSAIAGMVVYLVREGAQLGDASSQDVSRIQCFTVQFDKDSGIDEWDVAQRTANFLGVKLNLVHVSEEAIAARFEDVVWHSEALMPDVGGAGKLAIAEAAHEAGFKMVVTAAFITPALSEGSDEHFAGYFQFQSDFLLELDESWIPDDYTPQAHELAIQQTPTKHMAGIKWAVPPTLASKTKTLNNTSIAGLFANSLPLFHVSWATEKEKLNTSDAQTVFVDSLDGETRHNMMGSWHPLHTSEYVWTKVAFANSLLRCLGDNVDMAYQIESRPAFLDHHLTEYANTLPPALKLKYDYTTGKLREKHVLREAVKPFVTEEVHKRTNQPYLGPVRYSVEGAMHKKLKELVTKENVETLGFVDWEKTSELVHKAFEGGDLLASGAAITVAQYIVLGRRLGVKTAVPPAIAH